MFRPGLKARDLFPIFSPEVWRRAGKPSHLAYLDSAASTQKPKVVIDRMSEFLSSEYANIHRGAYSLSAHSTELYDLSRQKVADFLGVKDAREVVFIRGTTEGINLVARGAENLIQPGDVILLTLLEHHSNIVPWQMLATRRGAKVIFSEVEDDGSLSLSDFTEKVRIHKPKIVAVTQQSNALGVITPIKEVIQTAQDAGALVLVDGAQGSVHSRESVDELGCDFYVFSGHKLYGPTGIGVLWGKYEALSKLEPFQGGGDMISYVSTEGSTWAEIPQKFEAGTPAIAEAIGLAAALDFISSFEAEEVRSYEDQIFNIAIEKLSKEPGVAVNGPWRRGLQRSIISFSVDGVHPHDLASVADTLNVQFRAGHHCAMPLHKRLFSGRPTARISFGLYSVEEDIDLLIEAIRKGRKILG